MEVFFFKTSRILGAQKSKIFQKCFIFFTFFLDSSRWLVLINYIDGMDKQNVQEPPDTNGFFFHFIFRIIHKYMGVSKNRGTPKYMVYNGKPY